MNSVDLLLPVFNMPLYLEEALGSIFLSDGVGKKFTIHCILIDDGSIPRIELSKDLVEKTTSVEITHIRIEHGGKSAAINEGLKLAKGKYVTILDADDKLPLNSISKRLEVAKETDADIVLGGFQTFDDSDMIHYRKPPQTNAEGLVHQLLTNIKSPLHLNSMLIKRSLIEKVGNFDKDLLRGQDKDYAIRLLKETENIHVIDQPVYSYRRYERGWKKQIAIRLLTMKCKSRIINKHTHGLGRLFYQLWGWAVELMKLGYELVFGVYKR